MAYIYESKVLGMFNFTVPGEDRNVQLVKGMRVTVQKQLHGNYLNALRLVEIVEEAEQNKPVKKKPAPKRKPRTKRAKVTDKITKVEEKVEVKTEDTVTKVKEAEVVDEPTPKPAPKRRTRRKPAAKN